MSGTLGLTSPWARRLFSAADKAALEATIPDGWAVGVSVDAGHHRVRAWPVRHVEGRRIPVDQHAERSIGAARQAVEEVVRWIEAQPAGYPARGDAAEGPQAPANQRPADAGHNAGRPPAAREAGTKP